MKSTPTLLQQHLTCRRATRNIKKAAKSSNTSPTAPNFDDDAFLRCDFAKFERPGTLHNAFTALRKWRAQNSGAFPSEKDADAVVALFDKTSEDKCEEICRDLARTSAGDLSPMAAFLGGVAGQEVLKACTGKFAPVRASVLSHRRRRGWTPSPRRDGTVARTRHGRERVPQYLYHDCLEALPESADRTPKNDKNDSVRVVFGDDMVAKLASLNYFLVGAGAIGCEVLKNWS